MIFALRIRCGRIGTGIPFGRRNIQDRGDDADAQIGGGHAGTQEWEVSAYTSFMAEIPRKSSDLPSALRGFDHFGCAPSR